MAILQLPMQVPGLVGVLPNQKFMVTTDNLATITAAGYLNQVNLESNPVSTTDIIQILYSFNQQTQLGTYGLFTVNISNGVITLNEWTNPGDVLLPVVSGDFAVFNGTTGQIKDSGYLPSDATKTRVVMATSSTINGEIAKFTDNTGTVGDSNILATEIMLLNATNTMNNLGTVVLFKVNGTEAANAVTTNGSAGFITTSSLTTAAGGTYVITWTNSDITATSVIGLTIQGGTNSTNNINFSCVPTTGIATLTIFNNDPANALNGTIIIGYTVF